MGLKDARIELENKLATFYPGQTVAGKVHFTFDKPKKVSGIIIKFVGEAHTSWDESKTERDANGKSHQRTITYTGDEQYFKIKYSALGTRSGDQIEIPPGTHSYDISATLPPSLPSSFEGVHGYIRYTVTVILDRPWKFNQETKMAFTVINPLDLNMDPSYKRPIHMQIEKTFCCLCCVSAPLTVDVAAPCAGYVPGQAVPLTVSVDNQSDVACEAIKIQLRKRVLFRATSPSSSSNESKITLTEVASGPVGAKQSKEFCLSLEVPSLPPSNLVGCHIIDLDYSLKVECEVSGAHMNSTAKSYITIGTIPLVASNMVPQQPTTTAPPPVQSFPQPSAPCAEGDTSTATVGWVLPAPPPAYQSLYPNMMPPVYQESQFNAQNIQNDQYTIVTGRQDFAPRYPVYSLPPPQWPAK